MDELVYGRIVSKAFHHFEKYYKKDAYNGGECVSFDILTCANKKLIKPT